MLNVTLTNNMLLNLEIIIKRKYMLENVKYANVYKFEIQTSRFEYMLYLGIIPDALKKYAMSKSSEL